MPLTHQVSVALNADIGEGFGNWRSADDGALLALVTDANIACGFHAGDPDTMARTCELAALHGVTIGAHVGFQDLRGFGRRYVAVSRRELTHDIRYQLGALYGFALAAGASVAYVKPHGALYHAAAEHEDHARAVVDAIESFDPGLMLLHQSGSLVARHARTSGLRVVAEGFMDRAYLPSGALVPRGRDGAMITDPVLAARRAVRMVVDRTVLADDGSDVPIEIESMCIHSDSPSAVALARAVRAALDEAGIEVRSATKVQS